MPTRNAAKQTQSLAELSVGQKLGPYLLSGHLGRGGEGHVWRALHTEHNTEHALKILRRATGTHDERLRREAELLCRVRHPNIVQLHELGDSPHGSYLVMELVEGISLHDSLQQVGRYAPARGLELLKPIAEALQLLAQHGLIHRDIKPANILLTKAGVPKLADFGSGWQVAKPNDDTVRNSDEDAIIGTAAYIAPEQIDPQTILDQRADIFALGATLYHMVLGQPPCSGHSTLDMLCKKATALHNQQPCITPPQQLDPHLPAVLVELLTQMLATDRSQRIADYPTLLAALEKAQMTCRTATNASNSTIVTTRATQAHSTSHTATNPRATVVSANGSPSAFATTLQLAQAALAGGDRRETQRLLRPWKTTGVNYEQYWLLWVRSMVSLPEAVRAAEEGLAALPNSRQLQQFRDQLAARQAATPSTKCPFCNTAYPATTKVCPVCGGCSSLSDPNRWRSHQVQQPQLLSQAIPNYLQANRQAPDYRWSLALALAYLNLQDYRTAQLHLREVGRLRPDFPGVAEQLRVLDEWVRQEIPCRGQILLVDDSATVRRMVEIKLSEYHYAVHSFADGESALAALDKFTPDLALLDVNLPGCDGYHVCGKLKARWRELPIVMLTGDDGLFDKLRSKIAGAKRHVGKPFHPEKLIQLIDQLLTPQRR